MDLVNFRLTNAFRLSWREANNFSQKIKTIHAHITWARKSTIMSHTKTAKGKYHNIKLKSSHIFYFYFMTAYNLKHITNNVRITS